MRCRTWASVRATASPLRCATCPNGRWSFAITTIGAIAVPLNAWWTGAELAYGIRDSGAKVVIVDGERQGGCAIIAEELGGVSRWIVARGGAEGDTTAIEDIVGAPRKLGGAFPMLARPVTSDRSR